MNRKAFRQLLKRYVDNSCSDEERRIIDQWYELLDNEHVPLSNEEVTEVENRLWNKIQSVTTNESSAVVPFKNHKNNWWKYAVAASFFGVVVLVGSLVFKNRNKISGPPSLVIAKINQGFSEEINNSGNIKKIQLEDGSFVSIYPGSKLAFPKHFAPDKREVYLEGEALFTVSKNPNRPFFVYNNQIVTQVLGTSFTVQNKNGKIEVAVKTGRVAVYENGEQISLNEVEQKSNGVIITPNQKVTYYQQERHFVTSIVDQPAPVPAETNQPVIDNHFNYNETPLYKVLEDVEDTYKLEIVLENEKIKNCLFTGDLSDQTLFNKLESICLVFSSSYEIKGTRILLKSGKDCD
ncbi:MAG TPA: FecR family protein [Chitinophagaceae bacterium]|nr:FecR family protein [Chitinophagaceae bacterium]